MVEVDVNHSLLSGFRCGARLSTRRLRVFRSQSVSDELHCVEKQHNATSVQHVQDSSNAYDLSCLFALRHELSNAILCSLCCRIAEDAAILLPSPGIAFAMLKNASVVDEGPPFLLWPYTSPILRAEEFVCRHIHSTRIHLGGAEQRRTTRSSLTRKARSVGRSSICGL